ncbi:MAG: thermonuclease family protein [Candidatus Aenigmatarchaeota archaeon]
MKVFLALVVAVALVFASLGSLWPHIVAPPQNAEPAAITELVGTKVVTKVIDGDTIIAEGESIRLLGIDTDERGYPCYAAAKARLEELVLGKEVELEADAENADRYGRYLRYVFVNGTNVNLRMVEEGLAIARFSPKNTKYKEEILAAEAAARQAGIGCKWA